jgi:hypothetical protein
MKGINHLVLTGRDLEALRSNYQALGFTVTPRGQRLEAPKLLGKSPRFGLVLVPLAALAARMAVRA